MAAASVRPPWHQSWYRYRHFQQACRAFRPSDLLPKLAATALALGEPPYSRWVLNKLPPWGLAAAARESLLHGNEHRNKMVDRQATLRLMRHFADADEPLLELDDEALVRIMTRLTYEQFPLQE